MNFPRYKLNYLLYRSLFRVFKDSNCLVEDSARIEKSKIVVSSGATLIIGRNVRIRNTEIYLEKGSITIEDFCLIGNNTKLVIIVNDGHIKIGHHSKLACERVWVRFGGNIRIGNYTNINSSGDIRCDEEISIGSYTRISYNVKIWDTNTHNIMDPQERRKLTEKHYPYFGFEEKRPQTNPVLIGDDCWIGEGAAVLKGSNLGDCSIVGMRTVIAGKSIPPHRRVVQDIKLRILNSDES